MKKSQLKKIIAPIVQECIEESIGDAINKAILESGVLSTIISEVVVGMSPILSENVSTYSQMQQNYSQATTEERPRPRMSAAKANGWKKEFVNEIMNEQGIEESLEQRKAKANAIWTERRQRHQASKAPKSPSIEVGGVNIFENVEPTYENSGDAPPVDSQGRETDWVPTEQFNVLAEEMAAKWKKNMKVTRERPRGYVASKSKDPYLNKFA